LECPARQPSFYMLRRAVIKCERHAKRERVATRSRVNLIQSNNLARAKRSDDIFARVRVVRPPTRPLVGQQTFASPWLAGANNSHNQYTPSAGAGWLAAWQSIHIGICLSSHIAAHTHTQPAAGLSQGTLARGAAVKISIAPFRSLVLSRPTTHEMLSPKAFRAAARRSALHQQTQTNLDAFSLTPSSALTKFMR
jgi:hypothetical protein